MWRISLRDAGHWSVSDLCGIVAGFGDGCIGETDWVAIDESRNAAAAWATAFFELHLEGDENAAADLGNGLGLGTVDSRE